MELIVTMPGSYTAARDYTLSVILKEFLGLKYCIKKTCKSEVLITDKEQKRCLIIPDSLFATPEEKWLTRSSLPKQPLKLFDVNTMGLGSSAKVSSVPVIYGFHECSADEKRHSKKSNDVYLPIDIFGSAFFMLTRYEEVVKQERDEHDRFPGTASTASEAGFLNRPIVDEYVEILWAVLKSLWPDLTRKRREFTMCVSHDVDESSRYGFSSIPQLIRAMGGDILFRHDFRRAFMGPVIRLGSTEKIHSADPYNTFDFIMDLSERYGLISAFYFICGRSHKNYDAQYQINHPSMRHLLRKIHKRGHEIGLHPSYNTYQKPHAIVAEAEHLRKVCAQEGIIQDKWGGRMHYLRWETPTTQYGWERAGMAYDSTMSYADLAGFRCGTCHEYPAFDPLNHKELKLRIRPLIAMETTIIDQKYMGMGLTPYAFDEFIKLKRECQKVAGTFTLLWHNVHLATRQERDLYEAVIKT
jgi:hypothetical protein